MSRLVGLVRGLPRRGREHASSCSCGGAVAAATLFAVPGVAWGAELPRGPVTAQTVASAQAEAATAATAATDAARAAADALVALDAAKAAAQAAAAKAAQTGRPGGHRRRRGRIRRPGRRADELRRRRPPRPPRPPPPRPPPTRTRRARPSRSPSSAPARAPRAPRPRPPTTRSLPPVDKTSNVDYVGHTRGPAQSYAGRTPGSRSPAKNCPAFNPSKCPGFSALNFLHYENLGYDIMVANGTPGLSVWSLKDPEHPKYISGLTAGADPREDGRDDPEPVLGGREHDGRQPSQARVHVQGLGPQGHRHGRPQGPVEPGDHQLPADVARPHGDLHQRLPLHLAGRRRRLGPALRGLGDRHPRSRASRSRTRACSRRPCGARPRRPARRTPSTSTSTAWPGSPAPAALAAGGPRACTRTRLTGQMRYATPYDPTPVRAVARSPATPARSCTTPTTCRRRWATRPAGDVMLITNEANSTNCATAGLFIIASLAGTRDVENNLPGTLTTTAPVTMPRLATYSTNGKPGQFHGVVTTHQLGTGNPVNTTVGDCSAHWFTVKGNIVALGNYEQGTRFVDISDPRNPQQVGYFRVPASGTINTPGEVISSDSGRGLLARQVRVRLRLRARHRRPEVQLAGRHDPVEDVLELLRRQPDDGRLGRRRTAARAHGAGHAVARRWARRRASARSRRASRRTTRRSTTANVISTAGDAALSVADPAPTNTGHLVNGTFSLPSALQAKASSAAGTGGALADVGGSANPTSLLTYSGSDQQRRRDAGLPAAHRCRRRAPYRRVQQDADVHAVDDDAVGKGASRQE